MKQREKIKHLNHFPLCPDAKELENIRKVLSFDHRAEEHKTRPLSPASSVGTVTGDTTKGGGEGGGDVHGVTVEGEGNQENGAIKGLNAPEVKRMDLHNFVFIKVLGKGSFGKVSAGLQILPVPLLCFYFVCTLPLSFLSLCVTTNK